MEIIETKNSIGQTTVPNLGTVFVPTWLTAVNKRVDELIAKSKDPENHSVIGKCKKQVRAINNTINQVREAFINQYALNYATGNMNTEDHDKIIEYFNVLSDKAYHFSFDALEAFLKSKGQ